MKKVRYIRYGQPFDYKRIDTVEERFYISSWNSGGLTYFRADAFNIFCVETEAIITMEA